IRAEAVPARAVSWAVAGSGAVLPAPPAPEAAGLPGSGADQADQTVPDARTADLLFMGARGEESVSALRHELDRAESQEEAAALSDAYFACRQDEAGGKPQGGRAGSFAGLALAAAALAGFDLVRREDKRRPTLPSDR
ncbi:MAG: hypothetical protein K2W96_01725, partial [Gemmataceae bacterium]|nr:hypothetical protein [Gemmataceae bacterium]